MQIQSFRMKVKFNSRIYTMRVEQIFLSEKAEVFEIRGGEKVVQISSDRPLWRSKNLRKHRINWKLIQGNVMYQSALDAVLRELEKAIDQQEKKNIL